MPVSQGNYNYSMDIDPGSQNFFYKTINIVPPDEPSHDCPETVFEGSDITCKCTSSNLGTPPAEFAWDGIGTDTLFLQDIQPKNTTINYSCRLIWGPDGYINSSIVYTLRIAENEREKNTKGGIIGGCVAAVFILAIIGIVIAVYIVKRRKAPLYDTARRPANNEHSYDDLTQKSGDTPQSPEIRDGMIANDNHCYEEVILERPNATQPTVAPVYSPGDCRVSISNWMVIGSCTVKRMFSSDNNYTCKWRDNENNEEFGGFGTTLRNYTAVNSRTYTKGVCSFAKPIPTTKGYYTYSVSVSPGADDYFNKEVYIESQQASTGGPNAGLIGGVIAAVLVVLIIVGVLIVYIIRRRKGTLDRERGFFGFVSGARKHYQKETAMPVPYAVVNKPQRQTPIRREAGPSGDMYTITNTTSSGHVVDVYAAVCKTSINNTGGTESDGAHQTTQKTQQTTTASKQTTKPTLNLNNKNVQDLHGSDDDKAKRENKNEHCYEEVTIAGQNVSEQPAPAIIVGDNCDVRVSEWQIYGSCAVERMYASDGVYTCIWREDNTKIHERFQDTITYYVLDSRIYGRGVCSFSQNMPVDQGSYTYSMDIDPGSQNIFYKTINIVPPGEPSHDCPETVFVGSNVSCKCTSSNPGTPPAEFAWDGSGTDTLFLQDIRPENTTINYSCRLIWGPNGYINRTIVYTLRIAENEREKNAKGGIIGGCVAAVFILAIIGIVIAVYIVKRRKAPLYDTARRPANNEHSYDDLTQKSGDTPHSPEIRDGMITKDEHRYEEVILESPSATQPTVAIFAVPRTSQTVSSP
ncbi:hypothetical protein C0Q70_12977 [Pomacea canaliculata]|uniref:Ig-like domain-containing protein n=1 Tax=Pomacea canaliculata TaxID=400727 RepID=A0A2T7P338_POMCA|nr:hypothetical protein C0Q70_12977 [Pomacea canaliculata]